MSSERRPTVSFDRDLLPYVRRYTLPDAAPAGALARVLVEWGVALMDEAPTFPDDEARALLAVAREWRPRPRTGLGEPCVALEAASFERVILDEGAFVGLSEDVQGRLLERLERLSPVERLGLLFKLAWALESMHLMPGHERRPLSFDEALVVSNLVTRDEP